MIERAERLFAEVVESLRNGEPRVYTYAGAYARIIGDRPPHWAHVYSSKVIAFARATEPKGVSGLGYVRLDTFIVAKRSGQPNDGYWGSANHTRDEWLSLLGAARFVE